MAILSRCQWIKEAISTYQNKLSTLYTMPCNHKPISRRVYDVITNSVMIHVVLTGKVIIQAGLDNEIRNSVKRIFAICGFDNPILVSILHRNTLGSCGRWAGPAKTIFAFINHRFFTRGPFGLRVLSSPVSVCVYLCVSTFACRAITHHPFKLGSPNLDQKHSA